MRRSNRLLFIWGEIPPSDLTLPGQIYSISPNVCEKDSKSSSVDIPKISWVLFQTVHNSDSIKKRMTKIFLSDWLIDWLIDVICFRSYNFNFVGSFLINLSANFFRMKTIQMEIPLPTFFVFKIRQGGSIFWSCNTYKGILLQTYFCTVQMIFMTTKYVGAENELPTLTSPTEGGLDRYILVTSSAPINPSMKANKNLKE